MIRWDTLAAIQARNARVCSTTCVYASVPSFKRARALKLGSSSRLQPLHLAAAPLNHALKHKSPCTEPNRHRDLWHPFPAPAPPSTSLLSLGDFLGVPAHDRDAGHGLLRPLGALIRRRDVQVTQPQGLAEVVQVVQEGLALVEGEADAAGTTRVEI